MRSPLAGFVALLRLAGLALSGDRVLLATQAVDAVGLLDRARLHAALRASLCTEPESLPLFDAAFAIYWRAPGARLQDLLPALPALAQLLPRRPAQAAPPRRLLDAITPPHAWRPSTQPPLPARLGSSAADGRPGAGFDAPAAAALQHARELARHWVERLPLAPRGRRWQPASTGAIDLRRALRELSAGRQPLCWPMRRRRPPAPQVLVLLDASGSMQETLRDWLLALHALAWRQGRHWRIWAFSGSRLLALSPLLRQCREPESLLQRLAELGLDAQAGTRIGAALRGMLEREGPRLQGSHHRLLLLSDGLDHESDDPLLPQQLQACRRRGLRLLWLDPLADRESLLASQALADGVDERWALPRR